MKEAIITDINGLYIEPTLVADSVTGVFPIEMQTEEDDVPQVTGHIVAISLPDGLYEPTFDLISYEQARKDYEEAFADYQDRLNAYDLDSDVEETQPPTVIDWSQFWRNGLTDEEIEALKPITQPDPMETLGEQMIQRELETLELREQNDILGGQLVEKDLQILDLQGQNEALGNNIVGMELRLLEMEAKVNV